MEPELPASFKHMVCTGSRRGIDALFIEALHCGNQASIVRKPGILLLSIHLSAAAHLPGKTSFPAHLGPSCEAMHLCDIFQKILKTCKDVIKRCKCPLSYSAHTGSRWCLGESNLAHRKWQDFPIHSLWNKKEIKVLEMTRVNSIKVFKM